MADKKQDQSTVTPPPDDVGVGTRQVGPTSERDDDDLKADLTAPDPDREVEIGALQEPEHEADQTPYPVQQQPPIERPPFATGRPDVPIVQSAIKGAGAHTPPPAEDYTPDGRLRDLQGGDQDDND